MKKGWIKSIRKSKDLTFISATDGYSDYQVTITKDSIVDGELKLGASFIASGTDCLTPKGLQDFRVDKLAIVGESDESYPIQPKYQSYDFLRTILELRGRTKTFQSIWKIRHHVTQAIHRFLESKEFYQYYTPLITSSDCEGAGQTFTVKSDWSEDQLTVSGQLHGEVGMMSLGKIYTFGPCFRAEKSATTKHLAEFWMVEPEIAFYDLDQIMDLSEELLKSVMKYVSQKCAEELKILGIEKYEVLDKPWKRITYDEICKEFKLKWGVDIDTSLEKKITLKYGPTFITHYPKELKPFYMKKDDKISYCFDLIFPVVGELIGGSEREMDYTKLVHQMEGMDLEKMDWYLSTRKFGSVPHAGFGLGFERLLMYLTGAPKIHDVIPFPFSY